MVYLINDNNKQDVFIPRNDGQGSYVSPYDKGYQDGYDDGCSDCANMDLQNKTVIVTADTQTVLPDDGYDGLFEVDVDASGYGRTKHDEGYGEGYNKGEEDQKARLSSATFVENGEYTLENGWSAVTVQTTCPPCPEPNLENKTVELESGFTGETITPSSGYDGLGSVTVRDNGYGQKKYDDGFEAGENSQLGKLTSTAITVNGIYTRHDGWNEIDVQVPIEVPCNIESGKSINLANFPGYETTVVPSSGYAGLESVHVEGSDIYSLAVNDVSRQFVPLTATTNGVYLPQSEFAVFSSVTVDVDTKLESKSVTMTAATETFYPDSGSITVVKAIQTDGYSYFDTGIIPDINTEVRCSLSPLSHDGNWCVYFGSQSRDDGPDSFQIRQRWDYFQLNCFVGTRQNDSTSGFFTYGDWLDIVLNKTQAAITVNSGTTTTVSLNSTQFSASSYSMYIGCVNNPNWFPTSDSTGNYRPGRAQSAQYGEFQIYKNGVLVADFKPAVNNGQPCFYDEVSQNYIYNLGSGTPIAIYDTVGGYDGMSSISVDASGLVDSAITAMTAVGMYQTVDGLTYEAKFRKPVVGDTGYTDCPYLTSYIGDYGYYFFSNGNMPTRIGQGGFRDYDTTSRITYLKVPDSINWIGDFAFQNCTGLAELVLPSGLTDFSFSSVEGCSALTKIVSYAQTAPTISGASQGSTFNIAQSGVMYVPAGSNYSTWGAILPSGWTISDTL